MALRKRGGRRDAGAPHWCPLLLSAGLALAGCSSAPPADPQPVVAAFRECLYTYYETRTATARPETPLLERRAKAGAALIAELERRGVAVTEAEAREGLAGLAPKVERFLHTRTDLAFAEIEPAAPLGKGERRRANDFPGSFLVAEGVAREEGREVTDGTRRARYHAVVYERALVLPYDRKPVHVVGDAIYIERGLDIDRAARALLPTASR